MRYTGKVLVKIEDDYAIPQWPENVNPRPKIHLKGEEEPEELIQEVIQEWAEEFGRHWIDDFANTENYVICQEGDLQLPIDRWNCKITGERCPIQARIPLNNKEGFLMGCNIETSPEEIDDPQEYKEGLWGAIMQGKFSGEHHQTSRHKCIRCEQLDKKHPLHFPWAVTHLAAHLDYDRAREDPDFVFSGVAHQMLWSMCTDCFLSLPEETDLDFEKYGLDFSSYIGIEYSLDYS